MQWDDLLTEDDNTFDVFVQGFIDGTGTILTNNSRAEDFIIEYFLTLIYIFKCFLKFLFVKTGNAKRNCK